MQGARALLALVIFMGVLIVAGTTGLVAVVIHRLAHPHPPVLAASSQGGVPVPGQAPVPLVAATAIQQEPAGTRIGSVVRQSDTVLAIVLTGGGPDRVLVWDLASGRALTEIRVTP